MPQAISDRGQIDAAISHCLREQSTPLQAYQFRSLASNTTLADWVALHPVPLHGSSRLDRRAFFRRARDTFVAHQLELIALQQSIDWLTSRQGWSTGVVSISQVSLLVPGMLERLVRQFKRLPFPARKLCLYIVSHEDCDYPDHLAECTAVLRESGLRLMSNRFMQSADDDHRLSLDFLRLSQPLAQGLAGSLSHQVAIEQMVERGKLRGWQLITPHLPSAASRRQASALGVAMERMAPVDLDQADSLFDRTEQSQSIAK